MGDASHKEANASFALCPLSVELSLRSADVALLWRHTSCYEMQLPGGMVVLLSSDSSAAGTMPLAMKLTLTMTLTRVLTLYYGRCLT